MKTRVQYPEIPFEEYEARKAKAIDIMDKNGVDAYLMFNLENLTYFTGFRKTWHFSWLHAAILTKTGTSVLIVPQIMDEYSKQCTFADLVQAWGGASYWGLPSNPIDAVAQVLKKLGLEKATIASELGGPAYQYVSAGLSEVEAIKSALPAARFVNATPLIWPQRAIKSPWEQKVMARAVEISIKGFKAAFDNAKAGMTERQILRIVEQTYLEEGAFDNPMAGTVMMRGGARGYEMSTGRASDLPVEKGRQWFFDGGCSYQGYNIDCQRQAIFGEPTPLLTRLVEISDMGQRAVEAAIKPGAKVSDLHKAALSVIGVVPEDLVAQGVKSLYSHTFMGHNEGLCMHEPPWITAEEDTVLQPGMILAVEIPALDIPSFRVLGGFPEDIYLVTASGHECLTKGLPRKLYVID